MTSRSASTLYISFLVSCNLSTDLDDICDLLSVLSESFSTMVPAIPSASLLTSCASSIPSVMRGVDSFPFVSMVPGSVVSIDADFMHWSIMVLCTVFSRSLSAAARWEFLPSKWLQMSTTKSMGSAVPIADGIEHSRGWIIYELRVLFRIRRPIQFIGGDCTYRKRPAWKLSNKVDERCATLNQADKKLFQSISQGHRLVVEALENICDLPSWSFCWLNCLI